eukprot:2256798-Pyramimonas_sp.AAC.1
MVVRHGAQPDNGLRSASWAKKSQGPLHDAFLWIGEAGWAHHSPGILKMKGGSLTSLTEQSPAKVAKLFGADRSEVDLSRAMAKLLEGN